MKLRLDYLANVILDSLNVRCSRSSFPALDREGIYLLTGDDGFSGPWLYIGLASQLPAQPPAGDGPVALLCVEDRPLPQEYWSAQNIYLAACPPGPTVQELFNRVNPIFTANHQLPDRLWAFLGEIADGAGFTRLMRSISAVMGCSCVLLSQGFKMLGYCELPGVPASRTLQATLQHKYCPYTGLISQIRPTGLTVFEPQTHQAADSPGEWPEAGDAFYPLLSEDGCHETLGFLYFAYHDRDSFAGRLYAVEFIAYALSFRMWRYMNFPSNNNSALCFLLRDVFNGAVSDNAEIAKRLDNIHYVPAKHNFLLVIYTSAMDRPDHSWRHLRTVFGQLFPHDVLLSYNGDIVLLISSTDSSALPQDKSEALTRLLGEHGCFAGISACFGQLDRSLKNYYARALAAAKMARTYNMECRYTTYADIALLHLVQGAAGMENLRDFCDPRILRLAAYDRSHASDYIYTLQCYWHFNQNIQRTCDHLFIHRNTLFYRLKKIKQIVDLDFTNSKHLLQFNLSFAILTALGDIPYGGFPASQEEEGQ